MAFAIYLEARNPTRNIWRAYHIAAGQDLFGDWVVELTYGRIGANGRTKTVLVADEAAAYSYVRQYRKQGGRPVQGAQTHCARPSGRSVTPGGAGSDQGQHR
jgi:hypothetical protein